MKKIIKDRLNHLKSELSQTNSHKMDKYEKPYVVLDLTTRIDELNWILKKSGEKR